MLRTWIERALYEPQTRSFVVVNDVLAVLTLLSVLALILQTVESLAAYRAVFTTVEFTAVGVFTLEYLFGSLLYAVEGHQTEAANIPLAMLWVAKVILGGITQSVPETVWGDIVIVATRFTGLMLFGLLIYVVGDTLTRTLFGTRDVYPELRKR